MLIFGFDNATLQPNDDNRPNDLRASFHVDKIQGLVSRFASEPFEVEIVFEAINDREHVVVVVPDGLTVPVAVRRGLAVDGHNLLTVGDVYFRTLNANGTPSTARARPEDWRALLETASKIGRQIGRFLRRHLGPQGGEVATALAQGRPLEAHSVVELLREGERWHLAAVEQRTFNGDEESVRAGKWSVALVLTPERPEAVTDQTFLNIVAASNPNYTGWPLWRDPRPVRDRIAGTGIVGGACGIYSSHNQSIQSAYRALSFTI